MISQTTSLNPRNLVQLSFFTISSMEEEYDDADFLAAASSVDKPNERSNGQPAKSGVVQPKPQAFPHRQGPSAILVSTRQKGNPILNHVKSMPWEYSDIPCDYVVGATTCALFLSLKYHRLHPEYIYTRIRQLGKLYNLRLLLTMVDIENHEQALQELSKTSMINNFTLILCWSAQEAGRYLELFKSYEHASPAAIRARQAESWQESLTEFVTTPRQINKTDAASLVSNFGTLRAAINAQPEELALIPGWGEKKVQSWCNTVREPFRVKRTARTNAQLLRQETTMGSTDAEQSRNATPEVTGGAINAIPISRVPASLSRGVTLADSNEDASRAETSQKRTRQEISLDDFPDNDDEDAAFLEAEEAMKVQEQSSTHSAPELSAGVAAALAKYRSNA